MRIAENITNAPSKADVMMGALHGADKPMDQITQAILYPANC